MTKPASSETIGDNQSGKQPAKKKRGRPSRDYDPKVADRILEQIIAGKSLRRICAAKHMPGTTTVMKWLRETPEFQQRYARAREEQAEGYADELVDLARKATADNAHAIRVRADIIKWVCSKLKPQKYGDRLGVDMRADVQVEEKPKEKPKHFFEKYREMGADERVRWAKSQAITLNAIASSMRDAGLLSAAQAFFRVGEVVMEEVAAQIEGPKPQAVLALPAPQGRAIRPLP